jgi:CubicO group peptidase (beta-lactamase class C family)
MQGFVDERGLNGATVVVVDRDDGIVHRANFGEFAPGRISLLGSLGDTFSAGVLMKLHDDGLLDIDAPISDAVSWGSGMPDVTVAQLLSHSSGMLGGPTSGWYVPYQCANDYTDSLQACGEAIVTSPDDDADLIAPDTEFRWPQTGADLQVAGAIAEAVSGKSWAELVDETWVQPCGMDALAYKNPWNEFTLNPVTWGYLTEFGGDPSTLTATDNPSILGGAYATADDQAALVLMHLRDGMCGDQQVLSAEAIDLMTEDRIARVYGGGNVDFFGNTWGYGMGWVTDRDTGATLNGGIWGGGMALNRDDGFGFVVFLEATFLDGRALSTDSTVLFDSIREAVIAARG